MSARDSSGLDHDRPQPGDRPAPGSRSWAAAGLCLAAAIALRLFVRHPHKVEALYARGGGGRIAEALAACSSILPFSLAELALFGGGLAALLRLAFWLAPLIRRRRAWSNALRCAAPWCLGAPAALLLSFDVSWGLNYGRPTLLERLAWRPVGEARDEDRVRELESLARAAAARAGEARAELRASPMTAPTSWEPIARGLDDGYNTAAAPLLGEDSRRVSSPKRMLAEGLMVRLGVAGFYFPWTGETHVNYAMPAFELPHTIAHEKAHARGTASEDEANFLGFLSCVSSADALARYSGWIFAWRQLQGELYDLDPERALALFRALPEAIRADLEAAVAYWRRFAGALSRAGQAMNDRYLKLNRVEGGIGSYRRSVAYLILYGRRARLARLAPARTPTASSPHEARRR